ncbi:uncharacterized protein LOC121740461 [Aricia agestis]|uniref:uncharacterized protein LOC121740461 n=1 Tax=Aricia agestis TaxID=91739 RepID=UPI001C20724B|nr:uncharacterized protein LOC121740461 [Aricia agestis]
MTTASEGEGGSRVVTPVSTRKNPGFFFKPCSGSDESGNESAASRNTDKDADGAKDRFRLKRRGSTLEDSPEKERGAVPKSSSKRGRGRPPTTGMYVGLAKAKKDYNDEEMRAIQLETEKEILESGRRIPLFRSGRLSVNSSNSDVTVVEDQEVTAASVGVVITESLGAISSVARKSKNLKGTSVAALNKATQALSEAFSAIMNRSVSDETRALEAANARLSRELNELKIELEAVKRGLADAQPQPAPVTKGKELDVEELLQRAVREAVAVTSARIDARIEGLEARLLPEPRLRPPLAADRKRDEARDATPTASKAKERTPEPEPAVSTLSPPLNPGPALKQKRKKVKKSAAAVEAAAARRDAAPTTAALGPNPTTQWSEVVRRGGKAQKKEGNKETKKGKKKKKKRGNLRTPKSAAVGNLNHSAQAQDLWSQEVLKRSIDVGVIAEPYRILPRGDWLGDADSTVALVFGPKIVPPSSRSTTRGHGYVVADLGALTVVGVYFSPNRPIAEFGAFLLRLTTFVSGAANPVVVAGDFNAKSTRWGSPATDARGRAMADWLATTGLVVANRGAVSTCVRWQGESIVDLTLVSPSIARRMSGWRVLEEVETLSDHLYIGFDIASTSEAGRRIPPGGGPRWSLRGLDRDLLEEAAIVASMSPLPSENVEECAEWLNEAARNICDASMPRAGPVVPRRQTYWWRPELKQLRLECVAARRRFQRYRRRRNRVEAEEEAIHDGYRSARHALREAIKVAKKEAWEEFLNTLEQDPWGKPYKWGRVVPTIYATT